MKIIECPRDAMQGLDSFIPTELKAQYINLLLQVGFDTIDFGSFVSPKAIPQLKDTSEVLSKLDLSNTKSKLLGIVANTRGARDAAQYSEISYLGFPLSLSETFQQRNTNRSIEEAFETVKEIQNICKQSDKVLVTYISMGFGNPYGDPYEMSLVSEFISRLNEFDIEIISLADTIGASNPQNISALFSTVIKEFEHIEFGVHLHSDLDTSTSKIDAAYKAGCRRFDGALNGFGGCPMADDTLVGNIATETILRYMDLYKLDLKIDQTALNNAINMAPQVFLGR